MVLQETHADAQNEMQWICECRGNVWFSHGTNLSAGVEVLLSTKTTGQPVIFEVMRGHILRVNAVV